MTQAIIQTVTTSAKATILAIREVDNSVNNARPVYTTSRSGPALKQPMFDWKSGDKYKELCYFEIEVKNSQLIATICRKMGNSQ